MPLLQYAESGTEHFLPYAKKKLVELHDYMARSGIGAFSKRIDVSDGSAIYLNSLAMGKGVFSDKIRITGGAKWQLTKLTGPDVIWTPDPVNGAFNGVSLVPSCVQNIAFLGPSGIFNLNGSLTNNGDASLEFDNFPNKSPLGSVFYAILDGTYFSGSPAYTSTPIFQSQFSIASGLGVTALKSGAFDTSVWLGDIKSIAGRELKDGEAISIKLFGMKQGSTHKGMYADSTITYDGVRVFGTMTYLYNLPTDSLVSGAWAGADLSASSVPGTDSKDVSLVPDRISNAFVSFRGLVPSYSPSLSDSGKEFLITVLAL
jgi:hypothetical protein